MNLKMHHAAADRNLGKSRANFEFCLPQGINYSCLLSGPFLGFLYFFGYLNLQAKLCKAFLVSSTILWLLCELYLSAGCKLEPSIVKNGVKLISNISKSYKEKLV